MTNRDIGLSAKRDRPAPWLIGLVGMAVLACSVVSCNSLVRTKALHQVAVGGPMSSEKFNAVTWQIGVESPANEAAFDSTMRILRFKHDPNGSWKFQDGIEEVTVTSLGDSSASLTFKPRQPDTFLPASIISVLQGSAEETTSGSELGTLEFKMKPQTLAWDVNHRPHTYTDYVSVGMVGGRWVETTRILNWSWRQP